MFDKEGKVWVASQLFVMRGTLAEERAAPKQKKFVLSQY